MIKRMFKSTFSEPLDLFKDTEYAKDFIVEKEVVPAANTYKECVEQTYEILNRSWILEPIETLEISSFICESKKKAKVWLVEASDANPNIRVYILESKKEKKVLYVYQTTDKSCLVFDKWDKIQEFLNFKTCQPYKIFKDDAELQGWLGL